MFTLKFWKATAERVVRGAAIAAGVVLGLDGSGQIVHATLTDVGVAAEYGALGSLVLCLAGGFFGAGDGPSLTGREELAPVARIVED